MDSVKKFRKKPVVIEAIQWDGTNTFEVEEWCKGEFRREPTPHISIETLEGIMIARPNDYIIKGVQGEFYPCKPDIFEPTYDEVTDE